MSYNYIEEKQIVEQKIGRKHFTIKTRYADNTVVKELFHDSQRTLIKERVIEINEERTVKMTFDITGQRTSFTNISYKKVK